MLLGSFQAAVHWEEPVSLTAVWILLSVILCFAASCW